MASPSETPYQRLGGEAGVRELVRVFYDIVETSPEGAPLRILHNQGNGLAHAREAQFMFLSGFLGGPQLYVEQHRHANVKRMHEHLDFGEVESNAWLTCMEQALEKTADEDTRRLLMAHFTRVANALKAMAQEKANPLKVTSA
jgi:hemoglobin